MLRTAEGCLRETWIPCPEGRFMWKIKLFPGVLTRAIVLRFYFGQRALQEGSAQWSVWIAWDRVTDRDRGLCLSMSASWPLWQPILFMQKVICPCANCPQQTYMHTHIISSVHPFLSGQVSLSFCLCTLSFSYWVMLSSMFGLSERLVWFYLIIFIVCSLCIGACGLLLLCGLPCLPQTKRALVKYLHPLTIIYTSIKSDSTGRKWTFRESTMSSLNQKSWFYCPYSLLS